MIESSKLVQIFSLLLTVIFGILLATVSCMSYQRPEEVIFFFILFLASIGLLLRQSWGRMLIRIGSFAGLIYFCFKQIYIFHGPDISSLATMGSCILLIYLYRSQSLEMTPAVQIQPANNWTVLVIDDDLTFVKLVRSHFMKHGLNVISAENGENGIEMAKRWKPNLIILDVILPGMKGRSVCAKLKEDSQTQDIPVMFVTFKNSLDDISAEMELGAVMHLTKPVDYKLLYEQVIKILGKKE